MMGFLEAFASNHNGNRALLHQVIGEASHDHILHCSKASSSNYDKCRLERVNLSIPLVLEKGIRLEAEERRRELTAFRMR